MCGRAQSEAPKSNDDYLQKSKPEALYRSQRLRFRLEAPAQAQQTLIFCSKMDWQEITHVDKLPEAICPLCSQIYPQEQLHTHIDIEDALVRQTTIEVIQAYNEGWLMEHGACEPCWKSFRHAGCILSVLKQTAPHHPEV